MTISRVCPVQKQRSRDVTKLKHALGKVAAGAFGAAAGNLIAAPTDSCGAYAAQCART